MQTKLRIVIASAHPVIRDSIRQLVQQEFKVVGDTTIGDEAIDLSRKRGADILLLVLSVVDEAALSVIKRTKTEDSGAKSIALISTGDENAVLELVKSGVGGVVLQTMEPATLSESIRSVHKTGVWLDSTSRALVMRAFYDPGRYERGLHRLSPRERQIVALVARGYKNKQIANALKIGSGTVRNHLHEVFRKVNVSDRVQLALLAIRSKDELNGGTAQAYAS